MKKIVTYCFAAVFALILLSSPAALSQGQGNGPPGGNGPGPCTSPPCNPPNPPGLAPIDGGVVFLLISGILLGVYSLRKKEKRC